MIYLTSDWHLNHDKEFIYKERGFNTVEEMNQAIVKNFNETVTANDIVYVLGDCILGNNQEGIKWLKQLRPTTKILVSGNHDTDARILLYNDIFVSTGFAFRMRSGKYHFYLSHYPTLTDNYDDGKKLTEKVINLCGHVHTKDKFYHMRQDLMCYNVGVDAHDLKPVALNDIIRDMEEYKKQYGQ